MKPTPIQLLAQADLLQLMARFFSPPSAESKDRLLAIRADIAPLLGTAGLPRSELLERALDETVRVAELTPLEDWQAEHSRLFECSVACPINETAYVRRDKGGILSDVAGFYQAFALRLSDGTGEKHDHLVTELEFMALLLVMLSQAEAQGVEESAEVTRKAVASFAHDHLGEWLPGFCLRLAETTRLHLFANAGALLAEVWSALCEGHGIRVPSGKQLLCVEDDPGTPYECGMAEAGQA